MAVYIAMVITAEPDAKLNFTVEHMIKAGGIWSPGLRMGEWWRLVSAVFIHASPEHITFNMLALLQLGRYLEPRYAPARFLALYVVCGLVSSVGSAAIFWDTIIVQIGASGAIMGLVGAGAVSAWRMGARGRAFRNSMLMWGAYTLINGVLFAANNAAHAAGLLTGAIIVAVFGRRGRAALLPREPGGPDLDDRTGIVCERCSAMNPQGSRFCGACGAPLMVGPVTS